MTTYALGRWFAREKPLRLEGAQAQAERLRRWGAPLTALAWLPLIGDGLALAAGWLNMNAMAVLAWQALGRLARYWVVAQGAAL
jgi:membrane protein YqaA with SNARE-associated domain